MSSNSHEGEQLLLFPSNKHQQPQKLQANTVQRHVCSTVESKSQKTSIVKMCIFFVLPEEQEKLRKLPPNRVGANFDHSSHTDANWLPSFGRVWNSGRRWQSRWSNSCLWMRLTANPSKALLHESNKAKYHINKINTGLTNSLEGDQPYLEFLCNLKKKKMFENMAVLEVCFRRIIHLNRTAAKTLFCIACLLTSSLTIQHINYSWISSLHYEFNGFYLSTGTSSDRRRGRQTDTKESGSMAQRGPRKQKLNSWQILSVLWSLYRIYVWTNVCTL